ncbi:pathogenesis-related protein 1-like [Papaver somniferum]|uniref:pathogenesis-related protein 1-like n=1 Tax=Papaver somniferum TaxID=3469 RepID=UPI000E6F5F2C|nr:pathogenesis-related protein 1-like [Papaver somniferum]
MININKFVSVFIMKLILLTVAALLVRVSQASLTPQEQLEYLNPHKTARESVPNCPAITWNATTEAFAQTVANSGKVTCSFPPLSGCNIISGSTITGGQAVNKWVAQKPYYVYATNTCATGTVCAHYTQVVWSASIGLGCARVTCTNNAGYLVVCCYNPAGNVAGQRPYIE